MKMNDYQKKAASTAIYPDSAKVSYPAMGLGGEAGEILNKVKKVVRDGRELDKADMTAELGDVLWYIAALARDLDIHMEDIAQYNLDKLAARKKKGTLQGSGDNR